MSTMMMDRATMAMPNMGVSGMPSGSMGASQAAPAGYMMVPRCDSLKFEKCAGGMKITCMCSDKVACGMMQNLCSMLAGGMCSCCAMMNGMMVCCCNLTMGMCKCEMTSDGCVVTCTSGDPKCCEMIQSCCDCMSAMMSAGCTCCVMMNNMPVCCCQMDAAPKMAKK